MVLLETADALSAPLPLDPALVLLLGVAGGDAVRPVPSNERQPRRRWGVCHNVCRWVGGHSVDCSQRGFLTGVGWSEEGVGVHVFVWVGGCGCMCMCMSYLGQVEVAWVPVYGTVLLLISSVLYTLH